MTQDEIQQVASTAGQLINLVPPNQFNELADALYDVITEDRTSDELEVMALALFAAGVDTSAICKKKRPQ